MSITTSLSYNIIDALFFKNTFICSSRFPAENTSVANCDGSTTNGSSIYIDFHKTDHPCSCTVTTSFIGYLSVVSSKVMKVRCNTQLTVANIHISGCPITAISFTTINVQINQSMVEYSSPSMSGTFCQCLGFEKNGKIVHLSFLSVKFRFCVPLHFYVTIKKSALY